VLMPRAQDGTIGHECNDTIGHVRSFTHPCVCVRACMRVNSWCRARTRLFVRAHTEPPSGVQALSLVRVRQLTAWSELVFLVLFTAELFLKLIAVGSKCDRATGPLVRGTVPSWGIPTGASGCVGEIGQSKGQIVGKWEAASLRQRGFGRWTTFSVLSQRRGRVMSTEWPVVHAGTSSNRATSSTVSSSLSAGLAASACTGVFWPV
jgi:hypothetical protein